LKDEAAGMISGDRGERFLLGNSVLLYIFVLDPNRDRSARKLWRDLSLDGGWNGRKLLRDKE
jgi:hypothetical protein